VFPNYSLSTRLGSWSRPKRTTPRRSGSSLTARSMVATPTRIVVAWRLRFWWRWQTRPPPDPGREGAGRSSTDRPVCSIRSPTRRRIPILPAVLHRLFLRRDGMQWFGSVPDRLEPRAMIRRRRWRATPTTGCSAAAFGITGEGRCAGDEGGGLRRQVARGPGFRSSPPLPGHESTTSSFERRCDPHRRPRPRSPRQWDS